MTTTSPDQLALLASIRDDSDDDTIRLAYADWLDQQEPEWPYCENCKGTKWEPGREGHERCSDCLGDVPDTSNADRAELIRVQVKIADLRRDCLCGACVKVRGGGQHHNGPCTVDKFRDCDVPLRRHEHELLQKHEADWRAGPKCATCVDMGHKSHWTCKACEGTGDAGGLMRERLCPGCANGLGNDDEHGGDCPRCSGSGKVAFAAVTYSRGMKRVEVPHAADVWEIKKDMRGLLATDDVCRPTKWASAVCRCHPDVVEIETNLPFMEAGRNEWRSSQLPPKIYEMIYNHDISSAAAARTALARAVLRWARSFPEARA